MKALNSAGVWHGNDLTSESQWTERLSDAELNAISEYMLFRSRANDSSRDCNAHAFEDALGSTMQRVSTELLFGKGFVVIKGLKINGRHPDMLGHLFQRIGKCLGNIVPQNANGEILRAVTDLGEVAHYSSEKGTHGHRGKQPMAPHSDSSDIVGLFCIRSARNGGASKVCSSMAIFNEVLREHPEYLPALTEGFHFDLAGKTNKESEYSERRVPVFDLDPNPFSCAFNKRRIEVGMQKAGMPLNCFQQEAVDYVNQVATRDGFGMRFVLNQGDILFLNNRRTLHGREEYDDWPEPDRKRLLLRLWLMIPSLSSKQCRIPAQSVAI